MTSLLYFFVEGIACAIPHQYTQFVVQMIALMPPAEPEGTLAGTANIEGMILPVYSLRHLFGFAERKPRLSDILIIALAGEETIALWADETSDNMYSLNPPNTDINASRTPAGLQISSDNVVIIHDLPAFLRFSDPRDVHASLPPPVREVIPDAENPARIQAVLEKRARKMARPVKGKTKIVPIEVLKFRLLNQEYAFSMDYIREVELTGVITPVPGTADYIAGICAIRGEIISLVDLREFFGIHGKGLTDLNRVIVITNGKITFGILADFITGIDMVLKDSLTAPRPGQTPIAEKYLLGTVDDLIIFDAAALLEDPAMIIRDSAL